MVAAKVNERKALSALANHLKSHPGTLISGSADGPSGLLRLIEQLASAGHAVTLPQCTSCGKRTTNLPRFAESGRICPACRARNNRRDCDRCGRPQVRIVTRRAEGRICYRCYRSDPERLEPCGGCGRQKHVVSRLHDGTGLCIRCWDRPKHQCVRCGQTGPASSIDQDGPLCPACYRRYKRPRTLCGQCGRVRIVGRRGRDGEPDICDSCNVGPSRTCSRCGRERPGRLTDNGAWLCRGCVPRTRQTCARCERSRPVQARLPLGPVCSGCYTYLNEHPSPCAACGDHRILVGLDDRGMICGPCAGGFPDPRCNSCGEPSRHYTTEKCARCTLADRLDDLLSGSDGTPRQDLQGVRDVLLASERAESLIRWLPRSGSAHMLRELAGSDQAITHALLDTLPQGRHEIFLRQLLVQAGTVPARDDDLERIPPWLDALLAQQPDHRARLIRPFAHWFVLRRARRSAARRRYPGATGYYARQHIRVALEFLTWLDTAGIDLASAGQADVDRWLSQGSERVADVRHFLAWARSHRLTQELQAPPRVPARPNEFLDEEARWDLLRRSLHDTSEALDTRVAVALVLLFGMTVSRIRHLTDEQVTSEDGQSYLITGQHRMLLPPQLAEMINELARRDNMRSRYQEHTAETPRWLLPGMVPGRPLSGRAMNEKLVGFGMQARPARNAALASLAASLPPAVLADLLGLHHVTATRWAQLAARDWHDFVAARPRHTAGPE